MKNGAVLLVTLWILAILALLAVGIGFRSSVELKLSGYQIDSLKAYEIAKAGVVKAINELEKDETPEADTIWECGITLKPDETPAGKFKDIKAGEGFFEISYLDEAGRKIYGIEDMESMININTAPKDILKDLSAGITDEIADNIRAWRGDKDIAVGSISRDYSDKTYACKDAPFDLAGELPLVKDVTSDIFLGEGGSDGVKDRIVVYGPAEFKLNINTAGQRALEAIGLGSSAQNVVAYRSGADGDILTKDDNNTFTSIEDVKTFLKSSDGGGMDDTVMANLQLDKIGSVSSNYFRIRSIGALSERRTNIRKTITCAVRRDNSATPPHKVEIIGWYEE